MQTLGILWSRTGGLHADGDVVNDVESKNDGNNDGGCDSGQHDSFGEPGQYAVSSKFPLSIEPKTKVDETECQKV